MTTGARLWTWTIRLLAFGYPALLLFIILAFRLIGERWWVTTVGLYMPRVGFALPLPVVTLVLLFARPRRLLLTQVVAALLLLFPLMGLRLGGPADARPGAPRLRVLSLNIDSGSYGAPAILAELRAANADLVVLQEAGGPAREILKAELPGYGFHASGQYLLASRLPIAEAFEPPPIAWQDDSYPAGFMRYRVTTPAGTIQLYNVHPVSPRDALEDLRGEGFRTELGRGRLRAAMAAPEMKANAALRVAQVQALAEDARRSPHPVLLAGDTNLPGLSWALGRWLGDYKDGFAEVGRGLGYTFPARKRPWMRIDRIMVGGVGEPLRFLTFAVLRTPVSGHLAVVADLELPRAR